MSTWETILEDLGYLMPSWTISSSSNGFRLPGVLMEAGNTNIPQTSFRGAKLPSLHSWLTWPKSESFLVKPRLSRTTADMLAPTSEVSRSGLSVTGRFASSTWC